MKTAKHSNASSVGRKGIDFGEFGPWTHFTLERAIGRARHSIDVVVDASCMFNSEAEFYRFLATEIPLNDIIGIAPRGVKLTAFFCAPTASKRQIKQPMSLIDVMTAYGWKPYVVLSSRVPFSAVIVDGQTAYISSKIDAKNRSPSPNRIWFKGGTVVQCFKEFAEVIAENKGKQPQVLWSHPAMPFDWRAERAIAKLSDGAWSQLIKHFATWPDEMRTLNPRKFEEFITELFRCSGGDIVLTPRTRDGGRDILLRVVKPSGEWYYLVECKRYCQSRPVNVSLVRALYGVVEAEKATGGIIVTTSSFTKDALKFRESIKYRMSLKDFADIKRWVQRVRGSKSRRTAFNEAMIALS